eukprot:CAMPEP_0113510922 /NCGR_PEP_ID=MMETSP0014_2-20120614/38404_1 /TAXON_ID=2857 /ORGANISM="Nitzschia sp." /LENGTH=1489 /DNA_ID=CAMNT_0000406925 /DNA_START=1 /DNA_END=4467 /DNA_ORIENTATION=+ /assembly_acc=CAM_ASM_000159
MAPMSKSTTHTSTSDHDDGDGGAGTSMNTTTRTTPKGGSPRSTIRMPSSSSIQPAMNQYALLLPSKKTLCLAVNVNSNNNENSSRLPNSTAIATTSTKDQDPKKATNFTIRRGIDKAGDDGQTTMTATSIIGTIKNGGGQQQLQLQLHKRGGGGGGNAESPSKLNPFGGPSCFDPPPLADCAMDEYHHNHRRLPTSHGLRDDIDGKEGVPATTTGGAGAGAGADTTGTESSSSATTTPKTTETAERTSETGLKPTGSSSDTTTTSMDVDEDGNDDKSSSSNSNKNSAQQVDTITTTAAETSVSSEPSSFGVPNRQQHRDPLFESSSFSPSSSSSLPAARGGSNFGGTTCSVKSDDITVRTSSVSTTAKLLPQQPTDADANAHAASSKEEEEEQQQQQKTENEDSTGDFSVDIAQPQEPKSSSSLSQEQEQQQQQQSSIWAAVSSAAAAMMFGEKSTTATTTATTTTKSETTASSSLSSLQSSSSASTAMASAPPRTITAPQTPKEHDQQQELKQMNLEEEDMKRRQQQQQYQSQTLLPQITQRHQLQQQSPIDPSGHRRRSSRRSSSEYSSSSPAGVARRRARENDADGSSLSLQQPRLSLSNNPLGMIGGGRMKINLAATTSVTRVRYDMELVPPVVKGSPEFWQSIHTWPPKQNSLQQQSSSRSSTSDFVRPLEGSVLWIPPTRKEWEDCSSELLAVCTSAAWRQRQKKILEMTQQQEKQQTRQQHQSDDDEQQQQATAAATLPPFLPPLSKDYIHDRLQIDDPLRGYQIRHAQGGWLQGFLLWTNFTTWVHHLEFNSTIDESGIPAQIKQVRREQRQASSMGAKSTTTTTTIDTTNKFASALQSLKRHGTPDEGGIVLEGVAEIALVGGLGGGAGEMLLRLALEHIRNSRYTSPEDGSPKHYRYVLLQATSSSKPFYERYGFKRVGAVCRYGSSQPKPGGAATARITSSPDPTLARPTSFGPVQGYRHWTHAHETQASLDLHGGPSYMMCLELPDHDDPRFLAPASNLGHVMQYYCGTITKPLVQSLGASTTPPAKHRRSSSSSSHAKGKKPPMAPSLQSGTANDGDPPKRKRGRPRKKRTSFAHATNAAPGGDQQLHPTGLPPLAHTPASSAPSSKRRKLSEDCNYTDSSVLAELSYNGSAMDVEVDGEHSTKRNKKHGRGRPRRDSGTEGRSRSSSQDESLPAGTQVGESPDMLAFIPSRSSDMSSDSDKTKKSKQRPPGRPRRDPILLDQQANDESPKEATASTSDYFAVETFPRKRRSAALVASHLISEAKNIESAMWKGEENTDTKKSSSTPSPSKRSDSDCGKIPKSSSSSKARKSASTLDSGNIKTPPPSSSSTPSNRIMSAADYLDDCRIRKKSMTSSFPIEPNKLCKQQGLAHQRSQQSETKQIWYNKIIRNTKNAPDDLYFVLDYYSKSDSATLVPIAPTGNFARTRNERPRYQCQLLDTNDNWTTVRNISTNSRWEAVSPVQAVMKTSMVAQEAW